MTTKINLRFFAKKSRTTSRGTVPIYLRVSIQGKRMEVTINRFVLPNQWSFTTGRVKGNSVEAQKINSHLEDVRLQIHTYEQEILREGKALTIQAIREKWFGIGDIMHTLLEAIGVHNAEMEFLIDKDFKRSTLVKYRTTEKHVQDFIHWKYKCMDLLLKELTIEFMKGLEFYLQAVKRLSINSRGKVLKNVKKIVGECADKGWLVRDPFERFHVKHIDAKVPHLSADELHRIEEKNFSSERLTVVQEIFLFSCYTGFAYIDVASLTPEHLKADSDGKPWLVKDRQKTDITERVPLLPPAVKILEKYKDHPTAIQRGKLFPVPSNQKINAYLKEIADLCSIIPKLTFHIARHTFATTIALDNGVPIESVSQMLGHKFIKTTQLYAKVSNKKIKEDMNGVFTKYSRTD
jgi:site-specific recombinase XerD